MKFVAQHFPAGTIFEVDEFVGVRPNKIVTINDKQVEVDDYDQPKNVRFTSSGRIFRNGVDSYVIECLEPGRVTTFQAYNIEHVERIIERGDGPLSIEYDMYYAPSENRWANDMRRYQEGWQFSEYGVKRGKTHYFTFGLDSLIRMLTVKLIKPGPYVLDTRMMGNALANQSFVHTRAINSDRFGYQYAPKKRVDRWIKQNYNRFMVPIKKARAEEQEADRREWERDEALWQSLDDEINPDRLERDLIDIGNLDDGDQLGCDSIDLSDSYFDHRDYLDKV